MAPKRDGVPQQLPMLYRVATVDFDALADATRAEGDERIPVTLSSEAPVRREFGMEVLDHAPDAIDMSYAREGLAFLVNHNTNRQVGLIEDVQLGGDRRLRGNVRFSRSPEAQQIRQDMLDGIRKNISAGYRIDSLKPEASDKQTGPRYRAVRWTPMEVSTVPVPADITVGVGRHADEATWPVAILPSGAASEAEGAIVSDATAASGAATETRGAAASGTVTFEQRNKDVGEIMRIGAKAKVASDKVAGAIERGLTVDQFCREVLAMQADGMVAVQPTPPHASAIDLPKNEKREFSLVRALRAVVEKDWKHAGYERDVSAAIGKMFNREAGPTSFFMPTWTGTTRTSGQLDTATSTQGAELKFIEPGSFIELLRNRAMVIRAGARVLSGLQGDLAFPRQTAAMTFTWNGEAPGSGVSLSNVTLDQLSMSPKTGQSATTISRRLLAQSVVGAEDLVRSDIANVHALAIDLAAINGSGSSNQPTGVLNTSGIGSVALGTNGATIDYTNVISLETAVANANADMGALAYMTNPSQRGIAKGILTFPTANTGQPIWTGGVDNGEVNGYRAWATKQVPATLTKGTASGICSAWIFGNWNELFLGEWGTMEVIVDPYTLADRNLVKIVSAQMIDIGLRHAGSFAAIKDAL